MRVKDWDVVYKRAVAKDGSLLFPERLSSEFLTAQRAAMGSYLFANQYQNQILPDDERRFRPEWNRYWTALPTIKHTFAFIDPAIGQKDKHDFTGIVVVDVDPSGNWFVRVANRYRLTPSQIVDKCFALHSEFGCMGIGVEAVAYQEALIYMIAEEVQRRKQVIPIKAIKRSAVSKETRILGLVPRFEWARLFLAPGLTDLEDEVAMFPRGDHDDVLDALASIEEIAFYPQEKKTDVIAKPNSAMDPNYERWYIQQLAKNQGVRQSDDEYL